MPKQPFRHDDRMYLYIYNIRTEKIRPIQVAVRKNLDIPASFTRGNQLYITVSGVIPLAHFVEESRASTLSLWALFFRCTSKFEADVSGPGVYNFPGQSRHRILGRK